MKLKIKMEPKESAEHNDIEDDSRSSTESNCNLNINSQCATIDTSQQSSNESVHDMKSEVTHTSEESLPETDTEQLEYSEEENKLFVHHFIDAEGNIWNDEDKNCSMSSHTSLRILNMHPMIQDEYDLSEEEVDIFNVDDCLPSGEDRDEIMMNVSDSGEDPSNDPNLSDHFLDSPTKRRKRKGDFCFYCMTSVLNFSRHIQRHHENERDVKKILALPAGNKIRKQLFGALRKQGNYLICKTLIKPVKSGNRFTSHLPCMNCFGFYSRKNLYRHLKKCPGNTNVSTSRAQVDAQNFLVGDIAVDSGLKERVFSRMRADEISLIAKQDVLICAYAAHYLNTHQGDHCVTVASRKMREIGKLLQELQELEPSIGNLFAALRPEKFDLLIEATKNITKCNSRDENGLSPSLAFGMGNVLKQCCEEALSYRWKKKNQNEFILLQKDVVDLKALIKLLETQWRYAISNLIPTGLHVHVNKSNKVTLISLAHNLRKITDHLVEVADSSIATLERNEKDASAYLTSLETVFCRLILLNRRSLDELQTLPLQLYKSTLYLNKETQDEVDRLLSKTERVIINNFKRIITQGKRGKVPVLFSEDIQKHLDILLQYRDNMVQKPNEYLFGNEMGHNILRKYANSAGIQNSSILTYAKLKKQVATLSQLFRINKRDMEQLASFLGLILGIHISCYKLEEDLSQTTRISKLLVLMEEDNIAGIRGKNLKDIIDLNEDLMSHRVDEIRNSQHLNLDGVQADFNDNNLHQLQNNDKTLDFRKIQKENKGKTKWVKIRWSSKQKEAVETFFSDHINEKRPPRKRDCVKLKALYPELLENKDWLKIKVYIQNKYTKKTNF